MSVTFEAAQLITSHEIIPYPVLGVEGGRIASITPQAARNKPTTTITSGLLDIHIHGAAGHDVMDAASDSLSAISQFLATRGVTGYLATTITAPLDFTYRALDRIAQYIDKPSAGGAVIHGIHIEGPFLSHIKRGMHPEKHLQEPSPQLLDKFWQASGGHIKLMTIAPEMPGALETISHARKLGIRSSVGHSNATQSETLAAITVGATSATHTFNAMRPLDHREPGILGAVLDRDELFAELICDGVHVAPELVRLWLKAKGPTRGILITDSLAAAGMPNGVYKAGDTDVFVENGRCTTSAGVLAGSIITLDQAVTNLRAFTGEDLATAVHLASRNPAGMLDLPDTSLAVGSPANFNVFDANGCRTHTVLQGKLVAASN